MFDPKLRFQESQANGHSRPARRLAEHGGKHRTVN
jgi:hypothetical protein